MTHRSTRDAVDDLRRGGWLVESAAPVEGDLEVAEIQRRVYASGGPAVLLTAVRGCRFPVVGNLFGSLEQARYLFRHTLERVRRLIELKIDPQELARRPWRYAAAPLAALRMVPRRVRYGPVQQLQCRISELPQIRAWPDDGGPFITLPQVLTVPPDGGAGNLRASNLGMYRVQLAGGAYEADAEVGLHYQIHRGIGVHHQQAIAAGVPLRVAITVGGSPAMTLAAVMPLPEGLSELTFAGALAGRRVPMIVARHHAPVYADADFAIVGTVDPHQTKPEGPFGDHLGYYSLRHDFPVLRVERVWHRDGAIWPFTVVGRPPQEDTTFGELIHELTGPIIPTVIPGVRAVHAVDAAGVHPLLLAIGSERYMPYRREHEPQELLTQANAILGNGQLSLAKYLWVANHADAPALDIHDIADFFAHMLRRVDWRRDLHFQTRTTIDTLDYSGSGFNRGSKVVIAAVGGAERALAAEVPAGLRLPDGFGDPRVVMPGVLAVEAPAIGGGTEDAERGKRQLREFCETVPLDGGELAGFPLVVLVDDSDFVARRLENWLWVTFTRSNPAADIDGVGAATVEKHWGCRGPLVIDARIKAHHAPPVVEDPAVSGRVDALAARGGPLAKYL